MLSTKWYIFYSSLCFDMIPQQEIVDGYLSWAIELVFVVELGPWAWVPIMFLAVLPNYIFESTIINKRIYPFFIQPKSRYAFGQGNLKTLFSILNDEESNASKLPQICAYILITLHY